MKLLQVRNGLKTVREKERKRMEKPFAKPSTKGIDLLNGLRKGRAGNPEIENWNTFLDLIDFLTEIWEAFGDLMHTF